MASKFYKYNDDGVTVLIDLNSVQCITQNRFTVTIALRGQVQPIIVEFNTIMAADEFVLEVSQELQNEVSVIDTYPPWLKGWQKAHE